MVGNGTRRRSWFDMVLAGVGIAGALAFVCFYEQVSPYASIDFRLTRAEAMETAERSLREQGFDLAGYRHALRFQERSMASYYLQRTLGVAGANAVMRTDGPIWLWQARWFRPLQKEEFLASVSPTGQLVGFLHLLPEDAPGADLPPEAARRIAVRFLRQQGVPLTDYQPQAAESEKRPHRTDHVFTWEHRTLRWGEGRLRLTVGVYGDRVGSYNHWLKIPETFERGFGQERAAAETLSWIGWMAYGVLLLCAFGAAAWAYRYRTLNRAMLWIGGLVVWLTVGSVLNSLPLTRMNYPTQEDYRSYVVRAVAGALFDGGQVLLMVVVVGLAGDALARLVWPRRRKLLAKEGREGEGRGGKGREEERGEGKGGEGEGRGRKRREEERGEGKGGERGGEREFFFPSVPFRPLPSPSLPFLAACLRGLALAGFGLGFITLYKLVVQRLGGWYPLYAEYSNLYSTAVPWIEPLLVGLRAATSEELTFRLFAIALLLQLTRRRWLALLAPAVVWALLHSTYVNAPVYLRGLELTLVGLVYGALFLRFDVTTTIVAHYTYNAVIVGWPLLRSDEPYFFLSGLAVVLLPALPILWLVVRHVRRLTGLLVCWFAGLLVCWWRFAGLRFGSEPTNPPAHQPTSGKPTNPPAHQPTSALPVIRPVTAEDLPHLALLWPEVDGEAWVGWGREGEGRETPRAFYEALQAAFMDPSWVLLCAEVGGELVGYAVGVWQGGGGKGREEEGRGGKGREEAIGKLGNWAAKQGKPGCEAGPQPLEPDFLISQLPSATLGTSGTLGTSARVEALFVARSHRRQGLGTQLWEALRDALAERGATSWEVAVSPRNSVGKAFWLAQGLAPCEEVFRARSLATSAADR